MVTLKIPAGRKATEAPEQDGDENGHLDEQKYIQALGTDNTEGELPSELLPDCTLPLPLCSLRIDIKH